MGAKKARSPKFDDISATWLSHGDPVGFPPHPRGWFSIIVYHYLLYGAFRLAINRSVKIIPLPDATTGSWWITSQNGILNTKKPGPVIVFAIFRRPGCLKETL